MSRSEGAGGAAVPGLGRPVEVSLHVLPAQGGPDGDGRRTDRAANLLDRSDCTGGQTAGAGGGDYRETSGGRHSSLDADWRQAKHCNEHRQVLSSSQGNLTASGSQSLW